VQGRIVQKPPRKKTPWEIRLEYLESISLDGIVAEINQKRFKKLLDTLAAPSAHEKRKMVRLMKLHDAGRLTELPTDQRASAVRMRTLLIGLHRTCGMHPSCVIEIPRLGANCRPQLSPATCERAVRDLAEGSLVIADRERARPRRYGGQGPSSYQIVWSTITDLALSQGHQSSLFDREAVSGLPPSECGSAPALCGTGPALCGSAPALSAPQCARADVLSISPFITSSPPESQPPTHSLSPVAFPQRAGDRGAESQGEKKNFCNSPEWKCAAARLERYGVYFTRDTINRAASRGWSPEQVGELLGACESKTIALSTGRVYAWPPGLVCRHLQVAPPGAPVAILPAEAFVRAKRDHDRDLSFRAAQAATVAEASRGPSLESEWGPALDALNETERETLVQEVLTAKPYITARLVKAAPNRFREILLDELKSRATQPLITEVKCESENQTA
jgi:hypothetical protein